MSLASPQGTPPRTRRWRLLLLGWGIATVPSTLLGAGPTLKIEVDARELPRRLLHSRITIPVAPGLLALWYPKWIPGAHAPSGPLDSVGGLRIETAEGRALPWDRDELELYRIHCEVPSGCHEIVVHLDTICTTPAVEASGHLSYGNGSLGILNWATCLVYPSGSTAHETRVELALRLPSSWRHASALVADRLEDGLLRFNPVSLEELVDSPLIAGEHLRSIPLDVGANPPATLHVASESPSAVNLPKSVIDRYSRVVREAGVLFGAFPYRQYHFLVTCSDDLGYLGLEHLSSSLNGVRERDLIDDTRRKGWVANLVPHEYVHAWCGKFRRPAEMIAPDFHTPLKTRLLWVYEGLAQYLGELLMVRSGLATPEEYRTTLAQTIGQLMLRTGRRWRSLEDTAVASRLLRGGSPGWSELRRGQDYYFEGALLWLEADAIIRQRTHGERSLDDFCRRFLGPQPSAGSAVPYDRAEVLRHLEATAEFDWESLIHNRVARPLDALPLEVVGRLGYRLQFTPVRPPVVPGRTPLSVSAEHSLGVSFGHEGRVLSVIRGMAGDRAGLAPGQLVMGVNGRRFSPERLDDALAESVAARKIELLLLEGDRFRTIELDYRDGPRYLELVRDESKPDLLAEILRPAAADSANSAP